MDRSTDGWMDGTFTMDGANGKEFFGKIFEEESYI